MNRIFVYSIQFSNEFASWWMREFRALLPGPKRAGPPFLAGEHVRLTAQSDAIEFEYMSGSKLKSRVVLPTQGSSGDELQRHIRKFKDIPVIAVLDDLWFFKRNIHIPVMPKAAALKAVDQELDHRMPFKKAEVFVGTHINWDKTQEGRVPVYQLIVPSSRLDEVCHLWNLPPTLLHGVMMKDAGVHADCLILTQHGTKRIRPSSRGWALGLVAAAVSLGILNIGLVWYKLDLQETRLTEEVAGQKKMALKQRDLLTKFTTRSQFIQQVAAKLTLPQKSEIWNELSRLLPADCWLSELEIDDNQVVMTGISSNAAALVKLIDGSSYFENAALAAPVVADANQGKEQFTIHTALKKRNPMGTGVE